jgi:hypothetical protein
VWRRIPKFLDEVDQAVEICQSRTLVQAGISEEHTFVNTPFGEDGQFVLGEWGDGLLGGNEAAAVGADQRHR